MGVRGLQSFVRNHKILQDFTLEIGSELVVDGTALIRSLHQGNTILYGGEYATFTRQCECFFSNMKSAGIKMYIIFDGGFDESKYDIIIARHEKKLNLLAKIARGDKWKNDYLAVFTMECFMDVVQKFRDTVETHTAPYEADPEVARLAEEKGCLALSNDYDLLIYNLTNGFLPLHTLDIATLKRQPKGSVHRLACQRVLARDLARALQIDIDHLPTFAALRMHFHADESDGFEATAKQIKNEDCINECLQSFPPREKQEWKRKIGVTCRSFQLQGLTSQEQTNPPEVTSSDLRIPERMQMLIESGRMYHGVLVVWENREFIPVKQVEDFTERSSSNVSRSIRGFWYGIICAGDRDRPIVTEHNRKPARRNGNLQIQSSRCKVKLKQEVTFQDGQTVSLSDPESLTELDNRRVLMVALEGEEAEHNLDRFDDDLQLTLLATRFWLRKVRPADHIKEAIVSLLFGADHIKEAIVSLLFGNAASYKSTQRREPPFLLDVAHAYAQWQSCLISAHDLNLILGSPLSDFRKDILPNGSDLHRLACALQNGYQLPRCESQMLVEKFLNQ